MVYVGNPKMQIKGSGYSVGIHDYPPAPPGPTSLMIVASEGSFPNGTLNTTTQNAGISRQPVIMGQDADTIVLAFDNAYIGVFGVAGIPSDSMDLVKVSLEKDGGINVPVTFSGARLATLSAGQTDFHSDAILPSSFSLSKFSRDEKYWVRVAIKRQNQTNHIVGPNLAPTVITGSRFYFYDPTVDTSAKDQVDNTGVLTIPTGGGTNNNGYGCSAILGLPHASGKLSVLGMGDSLTYANADTSGYGATGAAYFSRAALADGVATSTIAVQKTARGGSKVSNFVNNPYVQTYFQYANVFLLFTGTNDIGTNGTGDSPATVLANNKTLWQAAKAAGIQKVIAVKLWPRTSSISGHWLSADDQTYMTGWGVGESSSQYNDLLDTALSNHDIDYAFNMTSARDAVFPLKWISNGTPSYATGPNLEGGGDGTHPNSNVQPGIGDELRTLLQTITVT